MKICTLLQEAHEDLPSECTCTHKQGSFCSIRKRENTTYPAIRNQICTLVPARVHSTPEKCQPHLWSCFMYACVCRNASHERRCSTATTNLLSFYLERKYQESGRRRQKNFVPFQEEYECRHVSHTLTAHADGQRTPTCSFRSSPPRL